MSSLLSWAEAVIWLFGGFLLGLLSVFYVCYPRRRRRHSRNAVSLQFYFREKKVNDMNLKVSMILAPSLLAEDKFGNPTGALDAPPAWGLSDPSLGEVKASDDGMSAVVTPSGKLGSCQVQVSGMADGKAIAGSLDLVMLPGDAVDIVIQPGVPQDPPADVPPVVVPPVDPAV